MNFIKKYNSEQITKFITTGSIYPQVDTFGNIRIESNQLNLDKSCVTFSMLSSIVDTKSVKNHFDTTFSELNQ